MLFGCPVDVSPLCTGLMREGKVCKSVAEVIPCYYRLDNCFQVLVKGDKPASIPTGKILSLREWRTFLRKLKSGERKNPIMEAYKYFECLEENPNSTFKDVAEKINISKARVSQIDCTGKKIPKRNNRLFHDHNGSLDLDYFTERRLRPLTLMESDKAKIEMFREIKEGISSLENIK